MDRQEGNRLLAKLNESERKLEAALAEVRQAQEAIINMIDFEGNGSEMGELK